MAPAWLANDEAGTGKKKGRLNGALLILPLRLQRPRDDRLFHP